MSSIVALDARLVQGDATGDSTYWTGLLHGLSELDESLSFLLFSNQEAPKEIPKDSRFRWICLPSTSGRWWSLVRFPLAARRYGARALHTQYNLSPLAGRTGIVTIHDVSFFIGPEWFPARDRFLLQKFVPKSATRAARVVTVSETSRREIESHIPAVAGKVRVAHNGPNPRILPMERRASEGVVRSKLGLEPPFLLTVGTRWPRKNMNLAVEACERLPNTLPHRLAVTGKPGWGDVAPGLRAIATGFVSEELLSSLYSAADLYLAPSFHEGFGIPLLEAFVCGCPVLCSSGGALPEVAGGAAKIMPNWDPDDWAKAVADLLGDSSKLDSMRARGFERLKEFSWRRSAQVHAHVYREVAS